MELNVTPTGQGTKFAGFTSRNVTSKKLTKHLLKNQYIPHGFNVTSLTNDRRELKKLIGCIQKVLKFNNDRGGYNVAGWLRKGRVLDPGAVQPVSQYEPKIYIPSGDILYHITSITPTGSPYTDQEKTEMNGHAYDMEAFGSQVQADTPATAGPTVAVGGQGPAVTGQGQG